MAEVSYSRKFRPVSEADFIGDDIKKVVWSRMECEATQPQVWLFYGPAGTGKTTLARLVTKEYQCQHKINGHACGVCEMCREIQDHLINSDVDTETWAATELNIASDSGKAKMQEVLDDALQPPMPPQKYKILIFDECHMATVQAQNLLLKYIEEPPSHLIVMFCTTDKDKLLDTLIDRCQVKVHVTNPSLKDMVKKLNDIAKAEGLTTSMKALEIIAKKCDRNPRKSITKLEEIANGNNKIVDIDAVIAYTNTQSTNIYFDYIKAANKDMESIAVYVNGLKAQNTNFEPAEFMNGLSRFILDCIYVKYAINIDEFDIEFVKKVKEVFKEYSINELDTMLQIIEHSINSITNNFTRTDFAELEVMLTALRIGKLKLLSQGLHNEEELALAETKKGEKLSDELQKPSPINLGEVYKPESIDSVLQNIFGGTAVEVVDSDSVGSDD